MDPLSAFSLATGVVQFIDFTSRLLADTIKVYKSATGQSSTTVELSRIAQDLRHHVNHITNKANILSSTIEDDTKIRVTQICTECSDFCTELEKALEKLRATGQTRLEIAQSSLKVVLRGLWTKDEVDNLIRRLSYIRRNMMDIITIGVWKDGQRASADIRQLIGQQNEILTMLSHIDKATIDSRQELIDINESDNMAMSQISHQQAIAWAKIWLPRSSYQADASLDKEDVDICESILNSLLFKTLTSREGAIVKAYKKTFRWVFEDPRADTQGKAMWSNFKTWLQDDSHSMYWVVGKPGSGKSTLMKYILNNGLLKTHLNTWAGKRKLLLGGFYFWNAGTTEQKSHEGLLKTLLFECLSKSPELFSRVTPKRWAFQKIFYNPQESTNPPWSLAELQEAFTILASDAGESYVVALFIDGLDEFSGDHQQLLTFLDAIHQHGRGWVKICTSGRPWNVFLDYFRDAPQLRLQDLTKMDIECYIRSNFKSHIGFEELRVAYGLESERLMYSIAEKAHGVFLWVSIVVRSLLETLTDGSSIAELQIIIDQLPENLSDLYLKIFQSIPSKYKQDCSCFLQIKERCVDTLTVDKLWLADNKDVLTSQQNEHINLLMRRKVSSRTKGLLEVSSDGIIDYLHRTTHDWVVNNLSDITATGPADFDVYATLLKVQVMMLNKTSFEGLDGKIFSTFLIYGSRISKYNHNRELVHNVVEWLVGNKRAIYRFLTDRSQSPYMAIKEHLYITFSSPNIDVILAAQFCIVDYVRERVALNPSILNHKSKELSILEAVILGCIPYFLDFDIPIADCWDDIVLQQRVELATFLLDSGADPKQPMSIGTRMIDEVKNFDMRVAPLDDGRLYSDTIRVLLEDVKYSSQKRNVSQSIQPQPTPPKEELRHRFFGRIKRRFKAHD